MDRRSGGVEALSLLRDDLLDLCLVFSFDLGVSGSLSLSLSLIFEGIVRDAGRCEELDDTLDGLEGGAEVDQDWEK